MPPDTLPDIRIWAGDIIHIHKLCDYDGYKPHEREFAAHPVLVLRATDGLVYVRFLVRLPVGRQICDRRGCGIYPPMAWTLIKRGG